MARRLFVVPVFGALAAFGVSGCQQLLGLEDRTLGDASTLDAAQAAGDDGMVGSDAPGAPDAFAVTDSQGASDTLAPPDSHADAFEAAAPDAAACPDPCDMADGLNEPFMMASDAYNVYWVDFGDAVGAGNGQLKSCAVGGCAGTPTVWHSGLMDPRGIAIDASNVYWGTTWGGKAGAMGAIWSCALSLGPGSCTAPTKLATTLDPTSLAVDATYVYWIDSNRNSVQRVLANGTGTAQMLYAPPDGGLGVFLDFPSVCAVDGSHVYIVDGSANAYYLPKTPGGTPVLLQSTAGKITSTVTTDGSGYAYFSQQGLILRGNSTGSSSVIPILLDGNGIALNQAVGIAIDVTAQMLYWADWGSGVKNDGAIGRATPLGANPVLLQSSLTTPTSITVSGNYVYWLSAGTLLSSTSTTTSYVQTNTGKLWRTHK